MNLGLQAAKLHLGLVAAPWISDAVGIGAHDELVVGVVRVVEEHTVVELDHACPKWQCFRGWPGRRTRTGRNITRRTRRIRATQEDEKNENQGRTAAKRVVVVHADLDLERGVAEEDSGSYPPPSPCMLHW